MIKKLLATTILLTGSQFTLAGLLDEDPEAVIAPDVQSKEVGIADLDTEFFELGVYGGIISIGEFNTVPIIGLSANFHATEDLFIQANYAIAKAGDSIYELVGGGANTPFLTDKQREYTSYDFLVGWNIFPGEVFFSKNSTFNSAFYLLGGVGNTDFAGNKNFTFTWGTGYRIIFLEGLSAHIDFKDHVHDTELSGSSRTTHNIEFSGGVNYFF
ncbi:MAG: outer membrane beta-barrel domain-containing protein [Pseudomonadales bacterium]|nr:outer membrane beta-barrel domain-containing protein [Pseudomonadales bacterium]